MWLAGGAIFSGERWSQMIAPTMVLRCSADAIQQSLKPL